MHDVVHGPQGDPKIEDVVQQFDHAAGRAMADEHQGQDQLPQPRLGNRQVEEDLLGSQNRGEGTVERPLRGVHLLVEELPADLVLAGQLGDCFRPGEHLDGQVSPLLRRQLLGRTRNMNSCRSWPVKRSRSGSGITLRDRDRQSSLTIHVCFLRETVLVGTNHPNMEETGSLENPIPSGKCYLDLNRAQKWMNFYTKVLSPLVSTTPGLKLQVQFEVPPGDPNIDAKVDAAKAALRDLGLQEDVQMR